MSQQKIEKTQIKLNIEKLFKRNVATTKTSILKKMFYSYENYPMLKPFINILGIRKVKNILKKELNLRGIKIKSKK